MSRLRSVIIGMSALLFLNLGGDAVVAGVRTVKEQTHGNRLQVTLSAPYSTISWDDRLREREKFDLPLLYLHRQRAATAEAERSLEISISGLPAGAVVYLEALSYHVDVSTDERHSERASFVARERPCTTRDPCSISWTFDSSTIPSDFYALRITDDTGLVLWQNPHADRPDFVALDTWDVGLGAYTARVYYATLFPFARGEYDLEHRLRITEVTDFIEGQFVPIVQETWHTQVETWGFGDPLYPDWDADNVVEVIITDGRFALSDGVGTYTASFDKYRRPYPQRRIWWISNSNSLQAYDSLEHAYRAVFAHEFFHLMQWNVRLSSGRPENRWLNFFVEAQAKVAAAVQYPEMEIRKNHVVSKNSEYSSAANRFLADSLNTSYRDLEADPFNKYDGALYWRFLYEQFKDIAIMHAALEEMARGYDADIVRAIGDVMDQAFARVDGPFHSFEESLVAFARANYALRLRNGRCSQPDPAQCGGLHYDPIGTYVDPPLEAELAYTGAPITCEGAIPSSFGMDFVEVSLDPTLQDRPLTIRFQVEGAVARYSVQIWRLRSSWSKPWAVTPQPENVPPDTYGEDGHVYAIPRIDTRTYDRLALIVTRLDAREDADPEGNYTITLEADGDPGWVELAAPNHEKASRVEPDRGTGPQVPADDPIPVLRGPTSLKGRLATVTTGAGNLAGPLGVDL